jgi:hypothetical protein
MAPVPGSPTIKPNEFVLVCVPISNRERREFQENGFVTIRNAVDPILCEHARDAVWNELPVDRHDPASWRGRNDGSDIPDFVSTRPFEEIARVVFPYAEALVGRDALAPPGDPPLVAPHHTATAVGGDHDGMLSPHISYPRAEGDSEWTERATENQDAHVDGYAPDDPNGEDVNYLPLTIGATVYVDSVRPGGGGFTVWPGSHLRMSEYFESHTYEEYVAADNVLPKLELGPPNEISGEAGDLVLWHHNLVHAAGPNLSDRIRMAAIGRFVVKDIVERMDEGYLEEGDGLGDIWKQYPAISSD